VNFFFDRNLSKHIARMLGHYDRENNLKHQDDDVRFEHDTSDVDIINTLAEERPKPIWVTADIMQRKNPAEGEALRSSGMTIFFCKRNSGDPHFQSLKMLAMWPTIVRYAATSKSPMAYEVPAGKIGMKSNDKIVIL
jgi:hypothetical protein